MVGAFRLMVPGKDSNALGQHDTPACGYDPVFPGSYDGVYCFPRKLPRALDNLWRGIGCIELVAKRCTW
jgi:hypothetical protein